MKVTIYIIVDKTTTTKMSKYIK